MTKKELVEKICKEQNLDPKKLMRLNMEELAKMDAVVPDEGADILGGNATPEIPTVLPESHAGKPSGGDSSHGNGTLIGYDPVTGEPVYL